VTLKYRPEIDGLRALAVIAVILNHIHPALLPSGYLGVDIFFVISGYVITGSLLNREAKSLGEHLLHFYVRRIKRLFPALITCVLVTSLLISLLNPNPVDSLNTGMAALLGGSNLYLFQRATDYFASSTQLNVFTHTWSLGVEEQFYFFYPIFLWYALKPAPSNQRLWKAFLACLAMVALALLLSKVLTGSSLGFLPGGITTLLPLMPYGLVACTIPLAAHLKIWKAHKRNAITLLLALTALSLSLYLFSYDRNFPAAHFLMPARLWELSMGCLLFLWLHRKGRLQPIRLAPITLAPLLVVSLFLPQELGKQATVLVVSLTVLLMGSFTPGTRVYRIFTHPWAQKIGVISYSLYLWHWSVLSLSRWTIGVNTWTIVPQVVVMLLLAWASFRWIEEPFRHGKQLQSQIRILGAGLTAILVASLGIFSLKSQAAHLSLDRRFPSEFARNLEEGAKKFNMARIDHLVDPDALTRSLTLDEHNHALPRPRVYLIGDSHAEHYIDSLKDLLPERGLGSATIGWRCGYISPEDIGPLTRRWMEGCEQYKTFIDGFIDRTVQSGDVVVLAHRWNEKKEAPHLSSAIEELASRLAPKQIPLILLDDVPELAVDDPLFCEQRPWRPLPRPECFQSLQQVNVNQRGMDSIGYKLSHGRLHNVNYLKLRTLYCSNGVCGPAVGREMIYRDNNHLNYRGSQLGARKIAALIRQLSPVQPTPVRPTS
jgi:peptidoglycan/LPS O-acetylase OafA/YrhL